MFVHKQIYLNVSVCLFAWRAIKCSKEQEQQMMTTLHFVRAGNDAVEQPKGLWPGSTVRECQLANCN